MKNDGTLFNQANYFSNAEERGLDVNLQDQTTTQINLLLAEHLDFPQITTIGAIGTETIQVQTTGFLPLAGHYLCLKELDRFAQKEIIAVTNVSGCIYNLTTAMPFDFSFTTEASICIQNVNLAVNGSVTQKEFYLSPAFLSNIDGTNYEWDITKMCISMILTTAGDDGKFGNITRLIKGMYFRRENGMINNFYNIRENSDLRILSGIKVEYTNRAGGASGDYGFACEISFAGQENRGVAVRLCAESEDKYKAVIRDNLTTIPQIRIMLQGHVVSEPQVY